MKITPLESISTASLSIGTSVILILFVCILTSYARELLFYAKWKWDYSKPYKSSMRWGYLTSPSKGAHKMSARSRLYFGYPFFVLILGFLLYYFGIELSVRVLK